MRIYTVIEVTVENRYRSRAVFLLSCSGRRFCEFLVWQTSGLTFPFGNVSLLDITKGPDFRTVEVDCKSLICYCLLDSHHLSANSWSCGSRCRRDQKRGKRDHKTKEATQASNFLSLFFFNTYVFCFSVSMRRPSWRIATKNRLVNFSAKFSR